VSGPAEPRVLDDGSDLSHGRDPGVAKAVELF
jgi:hypothetical protein